MLLSRFLPSLLFLTGWFSSGAQESIFRHFYIEPSFFLGSVLPQNNSIRYLINDHLKAYQVNLGVQTNGSREWHQYLNYPLLGIGYHHSDLGNDEVFGKVHALYGTAAIKTFRQKYVVNLEHHMTAGLGFLTTHYHLQDNPLNMGFGGPVVFFLQYALVVPVRLNKSVELFAGPCFSHVSAGKIIQPNLGLHMLQIRAGGRYHLSPVSYERQDNRQPLTGQKRHQILLSFSGGMKQYSRFTPEKSFVYALSPEYTFDLTHVFGIGGGFDFYLDNSVKPFMLGQYNKKARLDQMVHASTYLSFQLNIGDLAFLVQPGTYIIKNIDDFRNRSIYKLGFRYKINKRISVEALLKAYWLAKADFLGFGVGYSFLER